MGIIYCWTNKITNKRYIGQTINPEQRKRNHIHEALIRGSDYYFHRSLRKHGLDAFVYEVLEENVEDLNERENFYIEKFNTIWPDGYNQCLANSLDDVAISKMVNTKKQQWLNKSDEEKKAISDYLRTLRLGKKQTEYQKKRAAEANQKKWIITHPDGKQEEVFNLNSFCKNKGWGKNGQSNLTRGSYKGYRASEAS